VVASDDTIAVRSGQVPAEFTAQSSNGIVKTIAKGQLNNLRLRPQILNEHVESARASQGVVSSGNILGQVFKASKSNINGIMLTLESNAGVSVDDFESYADSAALQLVWVETDANDKALLEPTIVKTGDKALKLPLSATINDTWVKTVSSTDYTGYSFSLDINQTQIYDRARMDFFIGDGANTKSISLPVEGKDNWYHFVLNVDAFTEDGGVTDVTAITKIGFRLTRINPANFAYIDNLVATPPPGTIDVKLWDMGSAIPVSTVTALDDGTQYTELGDRGIDSGEVSSTISLQLLGGKRMYSLKTFVAGAAEEIPTNTTLTENNYYAITLNYVDTNVTVYGPDASFETKYYTNGFAFTAPDEATPVTAIGQYSDLMFGIFSCQPVYINTLVKRYDATPGVNATENVFIEDANMTITDIMASDFIPLQEVIFNFNESKFYAECGSKFEIYYNDDYTDSVTTGAVLIGYLYEPPTAWG
jgi:hypothetical protein